MASARDPRELAMVARAWGDTGLGLVDVGAVRAPGPLQI